MSNDANQGITVTKVRKQGSGTKAGSSIGPRCNYFTASANSEEAIFRFGIKQKGASQPQVIYSLVLDIATARRVKDAIVTLLERQAAPQVRVKTQAAPTKKPG